MFENSALKAIYGPRRGEVTWEWRKIHNEELHDLYSPNTIRVTKSRRTRWVGHVARTRIGGVYSVWCGLKVDHMKDPGTIERILKWMFKKWVGDMDWIDLAQNKDRGSFECGNEISGCTKRGEFLD